jgi:hypothetical protein
MYTDASVVNQVSTFTVTPVLVSCGVGTVNILELGVFEMLMYSTSVDSYEIDRTNKTIRVEGRMRSITRVAGLVVEDTQHDFVAIAVDNRSPSGRDHFAVHFVTEFWNPDSPLCTPSSEDPDNWCMFGGDLFAGGVSVSSGE